MRGWPVICYYVIIIWLLFKSENSKNCLLLFENQGWVFDHYSMIVSIIWKSMIWYLIVDNYLSYFAIIWWSIIWQLFGNYFNYFTLCWNINFIFGHYYVSISIIWICVTYCNIIWKLFGSYLDQFIIWVLANYITW